MAAKKTRTYRKFGREVVDAKEPLNIHAKPVDIEGAVCRDHQQCVIANAIKRQKKVAWVDVGASTVIVGIGKDRGIRYRLDPLGQEIVRYFDTHKGRAAPARISLLPPKKKIGARTGEKQGSQRRSGIRRKPTR